MTNTLAATFLPDSEASEAWPGAVAVATVLGDVVTPFMRLFDSVMGVAAQHERWGELDVTYREGEHAGERWASVALLEPDGTALG